jgi:hypothetical protein
MRDLELDYERERDYRAACLSDTYEEQPDRVTCRVPAPCSVASRCTSTGDIGRSAGVSNRPPQLRLAQQLPPTSVTRPGAARDAADTHERMRDD